MNFIAKWVFRLEWTNLLSLNVNNNQFYFVFKATLLNILILMCEGNMGPSNDNNNIYNAPFPKVTAHRLLGLSPSNSLEEFVFWVISQQLLGHCQTNKAIVLTSCWWFIQQSIMLMSPWSSPRSLIKNGQLLGDSKLSNCQNYDPDQ